MKDMRELYQALLEGKTLVQNSGIYLTLENSATVCIEDPEQWSIYEDEGEMKPADWGIISDGNILETPHTVVPNTQEFGMEYHTEEAAKNAIKEMREANLLRYWVSVIDPDWKAKWEPNGENTRQEKCYIVYSTDNKEYYTNCSLSPKILGAYPSIGKILEYARKKGWKNK